jgi:hypothetical protein
VDRGDHDSRGPHGAAERQIARMIRFVAALAGVAGTFGLPPACAHASRVDDVAATRAYLRAGDTFERSASNLVATSVAAIKARANEIAGECPSALTYAPRDAAFGALAEEASKSAFFASVVPIRRALLRQARAIEHLTWSDRKLTRYVHREASEERSLAALTSPNVCADISAWRASAYAALPQSSLQYLARAQKIESLSVVGSSEEPREEVILRLLRRYEGPFERRTAKRVHRLEAQDEKRLGAAATAAEAKIEAALGGATL